MPINYKKQVEKKSPPVSNEYIWDRKLRKLVKREVEEVDVKNEPIVKVNKPEPTELKRQVPLNQTKEMPSHYIKVEDGSLIKFYNTKSEYLKDMAALDNL
jgi:hypothetical protein